MQAVKPFIRSQEYIKKTKKKWSLLTIAALCLLLSGIFFNELKAAIYNISERIADSRKAGTDKNMQQASALLPAIATRPTVASSSATISVPAPSPTPIPISASAPPKSPVPAQAPETPSINVTKAIVTAGLDTSQVPFGVDTSFSSGNKRLYYYVSYNGGIPDSTVFVFKWYQHGKQIRENQSTVKYASGNVWNYLDYDFQPGQYEVQVYANGQQLDKTSFNVQPKQLKITWAAIVGRFGNRSNTIKAGNEMFNYDFGYADANDNEKIQYQLYCNNKFMNKWDGELRAGSNNVRFTISGNFAPGDCQVKLVADGRIMNQQSIFVSPMLINYLNKPNYAPNQIYRNPNPLNIRRR